MIHTRICDLLGMTHPFVLGSTLRSIMSEITEEPNKASEAARAPATPSDPRTLTCIN